MAEPNLPSPVTGSVSFPAHPSSPHGLWSTRHKYRAPSSRVDFACEDRIEGKSQVEAADAQAGDRCSQAPAGPKLLLKCPGPLHSLSVAPSQAEMAQGHQPNNLTAELIRGSFSGQQPCRAIAIPSAALSPGHLAQTFLTDPSLIPI